MNVNQKLSAAERKQLNAEQESYQQIINEMTPLTQEYQTSVEELIPCYDSNNLIIDIAKIDAESTRYATDFVDSQIELYVKDADKRNAPYFQTKRNSDIFTLKDLYNQILQNKAAADMQIHDLNTAEKRNPRMFEVLAKYQQMRAEVLMVEMRVKNEMIMNWYSAVELYNTMQAEIYELSEGILIEEDTSNKPMIATHQDMVKRLKS